MNFCYLFPILLCNFSKRKSLVLKIIAWTCNYCSLTTHNWMLESGYHYKKIGFYYHHKYYPFLFLLCTYAHWLKSLNFGLDKSGKCKMTEELWILSDLRSQHMFWSCHRFTTHPSQPVGFYERTPFNGLDYILIYLNFIT